MNRFASVLAVLAVTTFMTLILASCGGSSGGGDNFVQRDRMGVAAVAPALIAVANRDRFNQGDPTTDPIDFLNEMVTRIEALRAAVATVPGFPPEDSPGVPAAVVASVVNPDTVRIDLSKPTVFPNGRGFTDEVIDPILGLVLNRGDVLGGGPGISDGVSNDSPTISEFPYAAPPQ